MKVEVVDKPCDNLLGYDFLSGYRCQIDLDHKTPVMQIGAKRRHQRVKDAYVKAQIGPQKAWRNVVLDTGFTGYCRISAMHAEDLGLDIVNGEKKTFNCAFTTEVTSKHIENLELCVGMKSATGRAQVIGNEIVIGLKFLKGTSIAFDTEDGSLRFLKW